MVSKTTLEVQISTSKELLHFKILKMDDALRGLGELGAYTCYDGDEDREYRISSIDSLEITYHAIYLYGNRGDYDGTAISRYYGSTKEAKRAYDAFIECFKAMGATVFGKDMEAILIKGQEPIVEKPQPKVSEKPIQRLNQTDFNNAIKSIL